MLQIVKHHPFQGFKRSRVRDFSARNDHLGVIATPQGCSPT